MLVAAGAGILLAWFMIAREPDRLTLNHNVPVIVAAVAAHDHRIRANLRSCCL